MEVREWMETTWIACGPDREESGHIRPDSATNIPSGKIQ